jgi:streptogramin lyase
MDAHAREAVAAEAAMAEFYGRVWQPQAGQPVRCPLAWGGGSQPGTVICREGNGWLVDTAEGRLAFFTEELERI